jgi:hypothetical protein
MYGIFYVSFRLDYHHAVLVLSVIASLVVTLCHLSVETDETFFVCAFPSWGSVSVIYLFIYFLMNSLFNGRCY